MLFSLSVCNPITLSSQSSSPLVTQSPFFQDENFRKGEYHRVYRTEYDNNHSWSLAQQLLRAEAAMYAGLPHQALENLEEIKRADAYGYYGTIAAFQTGLIQLQQGQHDVAREELQTVVSTTTNNPVLQEKAGEALFWIGTSYLQEKQLELAQEALKECVQNYPNNTRADDGLYLLGQLIETDDPTTALVFYNNLLEWYPYSDYHTATTIRRKELLEKIEWSTPYEPIEDSDTVTTSMYKPQQEKTEWQLSLEEILKDLDNAPNHHRSIYFEGSVGLNNVKDLRAGFSGQREPFHYYTTIDYHSSDGVVKNDNHSTFALTAGSQYMLDPDNDMFNGGYLGLEASVGRQTYRLHSLLPVPTRSLMNWQLEAQGKAIIGGITLQGVSQIHHSSLEEKPQTSDIQRRVLATQGIVSETFIENSLNGRFSALGFDWRGELTMRTTRAATNSSDGRFDIALLYKLPLLTVEGGGNLCLYKEEEKRAVSHIAPHAEVRFFPFHGLSFSGKVTSGDMHMPTSYDLFTTNPYTDLRSTCQPEDESHSYSMKVHIDPKPSWGVQLEASKQEYDSYLQFVKTGEGKFTSHYSEASIHTVSGDFFAHINSENSIAGTLQFSDGTYPDDSRMPYIPQWKGELFFSRNLRQMPLTVTGSAHYISQRNGETTALDPVLLFGFEWSYSMANYLDFVVETQNLFAQKYQLWEGYDEGGLYLTFGVRGRL